MPIDTADLVVIEPNVNSDALRTGETFTLEVTVRNEGEADSTSVFLRFYLSTDSTISSDDTEVGTVAVPRIRGLSYSATTPAQPSRLLEGFSGYTSKEDINLQAPSTPGNYYYGACVDAAANESDTTNNCSDPVAVTVTGE